jgi:hypothetical protein
MAPCQNLKPLGCDRYHTATGFVAAYFSIGQQITAARNSVITVPRQADYTQGAATNSKAVGGLHANGFALLPIEAGAITEAWPFHVSADARKEEDAQPDQGMISAAWPRSSGARQFCARCVFLNSMFQVRNCGFGRTKLWLCAN